MGWVPGVSDEVENVATPLLSIAWADPMFAPLSLNCTVPVLPLTPDETVAVKVTLSPELEGFGEEVTPVVVLALLTVILRGTVVEPIAFEPVTV